MTNGNLAAADRVYMQPTWTRLVREQAHKVLDKLSGHKDAVVFSKEATEVAWRNLPFYSHYKLYRLVNYATMPTFSMMYLSNDEEFITVDGTAGPIYTVNEKDPIRLNEMNVVPYLDFFFSNVQGSEGDVFLIKDPRKMPMLDSLSEGQQQSVISSFKPLSVSMDTVQHNFKVSGTLYYGGGLLSSTIIVAHDGKLSFQDQSLLLTGIHFPYSPYEQMWLEG
ncbi:MAG: hypothetical protein GC185_10540 [Alphaproteobacteria bacterium]|nr:hypothetical protein [Alphaproteobacteria bacterium]